jgi:hypothetical protein
MSLKEIPAMFGRPKRSGERGQIIVLMAAALISMLLMTGLLIDGGNAWAQERQTQNGTDAAAEAGATVLATKLGNDPNTKGSAANSWDAATLFAINNIAATNGNDPPIAYYTDVCGNLLTLGGGKASSTADAAVVGGGFPTSVSTTPDCPAGIVGPVAGVEVHDTKTFGTFFLSVAGITHFTAATTATAVTGFVQSCQDVEQGCAVIPLNVPVWFSVCSGHDLVQNYGTAWPVNTRVVVPICFNTPGNVGWIDWTPPAGGGSEVADCILNPCNPAIPLPSWQFITQTGTDHASTVDAALNHWDGQTVLIPQFDYTCGDTPNQAQAATPNYYGCPASAFNAGNGTNLWYHLPRFAAFHLDVAYTNGNNLAACQYQAPQCLIGEFVHFIVSGNVGPGAGGGYTDTSTIGVQLIK